MAGLKESVGFVALEKEDMQEPRVLNQILLFVHQRLAAIEGVAGRYTFIHPFRVDKVTTVEAQDPAQMEDDELITKGAVIDMVGAQKIRESLNTRVFDDERVRGINTTGGGGTVQIRSRGVTS